MAIPVSRLLKKITSLNHHLQIKNKNGSFHIAAMEDEEHISSLENSKKIIQSASDSWVVCRSNRYNQQLYYFNTLTGESVWNLGDSELHKVKQKIKLLEAQKGKAIIEYPEPKEPPLNHIHVIERKKEVCKCNITGANIYNKQIIHHQFSRPAHNLLQCQYCGTVKNQHIEKMILPSNDIVYENSHTRNLYRNTDIVNEVNWSTEGYVSHESNDVSNMQHNCNIIRNFNCVLSNAPVPHTNSYRSGNVLNSDSTNLQETGHYAPIDFNNGFVKNQPYSDLREKIMKNRIMLQRKCTENIYNRNYDQGDIFEQQSTNNFNTFTGDDANFHNMDWLQVKTEVREKKLNTERLRTLADSNTNPSIWFIVVDTPVLLDDFQNLKFLSLLLYSDPRCRVVVPKYVMNELRLHATTSTPQLMTRAKRTIEYLNTLFDGHTVYIGPDTTSERYAKNLPILRCCLELAEDNYLVILLSVGANLEAERNETSIPIFSVIEFLNFLEYDENSEVENHITRNINLVQETQRETQHSNNNNSVSVLKRREIRLKRTLANVPSTSNSTEKRRFKWRSKRTTSNSCPRGTKCSNNQERRGPDEMLQEKMDKCTQTPDSEMSNTNAGFVKEAVTTEKGHNLQNDDNIDSSEASVVGKRCFGENITIEETSTSNILSNTNSETEHHTIRHKLDFKCRENDTRISSVNKQKNNMFEVTNQAMADLLRNKCDEWVSRFVQIMEEALTQTLQRDPPFVDPQMPPPWTLYEAVNCISKKFHRQHDVLDAATKLSIHLFTVTPNKGSGNVCMDMTPFQYMEMYSYGVYLINTLQSELGDSEDIQIAQESLAKLWSEIQDPKLDSTFNTLIESCDDHDISIDIPPVDSARIPPVDFPHASPVNFTRIPPRVPELVYSRVPPVDSTRVSPVDSGCVPPVDSGCVPPVNSIHIPQLDSTCIPPVDSARISPVDFPRASPVNFTRIPPVDPTRALHSPRVPQVVYSRVKPMDFIIISPVNSAHVPPVNSTCVPPVDSTRVSPVDSGRVPPVNSTNIPQVDSTCIPSVDSTRIQQLNSTRILPVDSTHISQLESTLIPPMDPIHVPPVDNTCVPPMDITSIPPMDITSVPPMDITSVPSVDSSHQLTEERFNNNTKIKPKKNRSILYNLRSSKGTSPKVTKKCTNSIGKDKKDTFFTTLSLQKSAKGKNLKQRDIRNMAAIVTNTDSHNELTSYNDDVVASISNEMNNISCNNDFGVGKSTNSHIEQHADESLCDNNARQTVGGNTLDQTEKHNEAAAIRKIIRRPEVEERLCNENRDEISNEGNETPNIDINPKYTLNFFFMGIVNNIEESLSIFRNFCVNTCKELDDPVHLTNARKMEIHKQAEKSRLYIHKMCVTFNNILCRESNPKKNMKSTFEKKGLHNLDDKQFEQYRDVIARSMKQANNISEAIDTIINIAKA